MSKAAILIILLHLMCTINCHQYGQSKTVVSFSDDTGVIVNQNVMNTFLHPEIAERKIVLYTVVGVYRKGKSFFLDYCLRYLYGNVRIFFKRESEVKKKVLLNQSDTFL